MAIGNTQSTEKEPQGAAKRGVCGAALCTQETRGLRWGRGRQDQWSRLQTGSLEYGKEGSIKTRTGGTRENGRRIGRTNRNNNRSQRNKFHGITIWGRKQREGMKEPLRWRPGQRGDKNNNRKK